MKRAIILTGLLLAGCGTAGDLQPPEGKTLPVAPYGARTTPTPGDLVTPTTQQRPQRSDELLTKSTERRSDDFDLPPPN